MGVALVSLVRCVCVVEIAGVLGGCCGVPVRVRLWVKWSAQCQVWGGKACFQRSEVLLSSISDTWTVIVSKRFGIDLNEVDDKSSINRVNLLLFVMGINLRYTSRDSMFWVCVLQRVVRYC